MEHPNRITDMSDTSYVRDMQTVLLLGNTGPTGTLRGVYDRAYELYLPVVAEVCARDANEHEVVYLLDHLLDFAGDPRIHRLYTELCDAYFFRFPELMADYTYLWRDIYDVA